MNKKTVLNVLIACEESQVECGAFRALGHNAFSCDVLVHRRGGNPAWHIHCDVLQLFQLKKDFRFTTMDGKCHQVKHWDLIICHPPCTYLCKSGSIHMCAKHEPSEKQSPSDDWYQLPSGTWYNRTRLRLMRAARVFFLQCLDAPAKYVAVENPIPMKRAKLPPCSTFVQPCWFGEPFTKKTLLWIKNLPPLMPTAIHPNPKQFVRSSRGKYRSRSFKGIAQAMATQWSSFILNEINNRK